MKFTSSSYLDILNGTTKHADYSYVMGRTSVFPVGSFLKQNLTYKLMLLLLTSAKRRLPIAP